MLFGAGITGQRVSRLVGVSMLDVSDILEGVGRNEVLNSSLR